MEAQNYSDIIFYNSPTGAVKVEVIYNEEPFGLSLKRMAKLLGIDVRNGSINICRISLKVAS